MKLIVAVADNMGVLFNHRRQSRDSAVVADVAQMVTGAHLWVTPYTKGLFDEVPDLELQVDSNPVSCAGTGEFYFVEDGGFPPSEMAVEEVVLYRWNRDYPADVRLPFDLAAPQWKLICTKDILGTSHTNITKEVYQYVS